MRRPSALTAWFVFCVAGAGSSAEDDVDLREGYDVLAYRLDLLIDADDRQIQGVAGIEARVTAEALETIVLDSHRKLQVQAVTWIDGDLLAEVLDEASVVGWQQSGNQLHVTPPAALSQGDVFRLAVQYQGRPMVKDDFTGFHFSKTPAGEPWIASSCQTIGSHTWWPCKSSFFHPEDKCDRVAVNVTVPAGLVAASNGVLQGVDETGDMKTYRWLHEYPLPTYAVAVAVGPYRILEDAFELPGCEQPVQVRYFVLPEDEEKAEMEFAVAEELLCFYSDKFGPYPFPKSKYCLAQTPFWGMEHSTVIAYGNSFPTWRKERGLDDVFAERNRLYDYILVHETAHEWWGNAISARTWGDFWLHEGFATYSEALWVEHRLGLDAYLDFMQDSKRSISTTDSVFRPEHASADEAYASILYDKGAFVLHMLRYFMRDVSAEDPSQRDISFFAALKEFGSAPQLRYGTASTKDFQRICERHFGGRLDRFFQPWLYGVGWPRYTVRRKEPTENKVAVEIAVRGRSLFPFRMPMDIELHCVDDSVVPHRVWLNEPVNQFLLEAPAHIREVKYPGFRWILCDVNFVP